MKNFKEVSYISDSDLQPLVMCEVLISVWLLCSQLPESCCFFLL